MTREIETIPEHRAIEGWHFLAADRRLQHGDGRLVVQGGILSVETPLELCRRGLHCGERAIDALEFAPGAIACRVLAWGQVIRGNAQLCCEHRKVLTMEDASRALLDIALQWMGSAVGAVVTKGWSRIQEGDRAAIKARIAARAAMAAADGQDRKKAAAARREALNQQLTGILMGLSAGVTAGGSAWR